jgi:hypothetical protein
MLPTRSLRVVVAAFAVVAAACGSPTKPKATSINALNSYSLNAFTGAPANAATAISFFGGVSTVPGPVHADARFAFDVAVDLDQSGRALVYPVRTIGSGLVGSLKRVGLQVVPGTFDALREAPATGYDTLAVQTVAPGAVLAVELLDNNFCLYSLGGQMLYAKLVVDSVNVGTRRLFARSVIDPNCGYRSVVPDSLPSS